jgi:hypothetical protein
MRHAVKYGEKKHILTSQSGLLKVILGVIDAPS